MGVHVCVFAFGEMIEEEACQINVFMFMDCFLKNPNTVNSVILVSGQFAERIMIVHMLGRKLSTFSLVEMSPQIWTFLKHGFYHFFQDPHAGKKKLGSSTSQKPSNSLFISVLNISVLQILFYTGIQPKNSPTFPHPHPTSRNCFEIHRRGGLCIHK